MFSAGNKQQYCPTWTSRRYPSWLAMHNASWDHTVCSTVQYMMIGYKCCWITMQQWHKWAPESSCPLSSRGRTHDTTVETAHNIHEVTLSFNTHIHAYHLYALHSLKHPPICYWAFQSFIITEWSLLNHLTSSWRQVFPGNWLYCTDNQTENTRNNLSQNPKYDKHTPVMTNMQKHRKT